MSSSINIDLSFLSYLDGKKIAAIVESDIHRLSDLINFCVLYEDEKTSGLLEVINDPRFLFIFRRAGEQVAVALTHNCKLEDGKYDEVKGFIWEYGTQ